MTDCRNIVCENFFRDFEDIIHTVYIKKMFKPIRLINRASPWPICTRTGEDAYTRKIINGIIVNLPQLKMSLFLLKVLVSKFRFIDKGVQE